MTYKGGFTKIQAILGTILVWFPILMPVLFSISRLIQTGHFNFDFLMPAEMFVFVLAGAGLLLWAAIRAQAWLKLIGWCAGLAVVFLVSSIGLAMITGLASGETEAAGWRFVLVVACMAGYIVMLVGLGVGGVLLTLNLLRPAP